MSRREYPTAERYEEREADFYRRPRRDRDYEDLEVDISRSRYPDGARRSETIVKERDVSERRPDRPRQPDFLREDYGKATTTQQLVVREDDSYSRAPSARSRAPTERVVERDEYILRERDRSDRGPPYPQSQRSELAFKEVDREDVVYRARSRPPPVERSKEEIDISIRRNESESRPPPPRSEVRGRDVEEITFRRGPGGPPRERVVEREEIDIRQSRSPAPPPPRSTNGKEELEIDIRESRTEGRRREVTKEDITIRERSRPPPPRQRSMSRGVLVGRKEEEWIVRRPTTPPRRDYEEEQIVIRRREKSPEPEPCPPPREPTPEPCPPPLEPIYRPPIIQEVITHHRHIDHGVERARSPTPPPPPAPACPPAREEELDIEIKRKGVRNGRAFEETVLIEKDTIEKPDCSPERPRSRSRELDLQLSRRRSASVVSRRQPRSPSRVRAPQRVYDDEIAAEADYYNRKVAARAYPGEAYNGATRDWGLVDVPPGTERVRMDGVGGGSQEITWQRYNGERRGRFVSGDRVYESEFARGGGAYREPAPLPAPSPPPPAPAAPAAPPREFKEEIKITTETRTTEDRAPAPPPASRRKQRMWTEVTKDLVIREAIEECGYEYEETEEHFYVIEYLRYVSFAPLFLPPLSPFSLFSAFLSSLPPLSGRDQGSHAIPKTGRRPPPRRSHRRHPARAHRAHPRDPVGARAGGARPTAQNAAATAGAGSTTGELG